MLKTLAVAVVAVLVLVTPAGAARERCAGLAQPVPGSVVDGFAPTGRYSGHWGVDWEVPIGTGVHAAGPGTVTFAGTVVGNQTVTVSHGGGLKTSYSYLSAVTVRRGESVNESTVLGRSGKGHGRSLLHFSVRVGSAYVDPVPIIECRLVAPSRALRLVPVRASR